MYTSVDGDGKLQNVSLPEGSYETVDEGNI